MLNLQSYNDSEHNRTVKHSPFWVKRLEKNFWRGSWVWQDLLAWLLSKGWDTLLGKQMSFPKPSETGWPLLIYKFNLRWKKYYLWLIITCKWSKLFFWILPLHFNYVFFILDIFWVKANEIGRPLLIKDF